MKKFENSFEGNIDKQLRNEKALDRAKNVYQNQEEGVVDIIQESDFENLYSKEQVEKDLEYVDEMEQEFEKKSTPEQKEANKLATIFEAMVFEQSELNNWLGENAMTIKSSRYDDIKNGIDLIVEIPDKEKPTASHLALAVDVTFSDDLRDKIRKIKGEIDRDKLTTVKYFKSDFLNLKGEKRNVPKVVIGADYKTLENVVDLWIARDNKALANHYIQFIILDEIMLQLENYKRYAEKENKEKAVESYNKAIEIIRDIDNEKQESREKMPIDDNSKIEKDKVFSAIRHHLDKELV